MKPYGDARVTAQRAAIAHAVEQMSGAFTIEELAAATRRQQPVAGATATVYRAVAAMEANGFLERVGSRKGAALYARCHELGHHHHVVCERCGVTSTAECPVGTGLRSRDGFVVTRHEMTLYGLCVNCAGRSTA